MLTSPPATLTLPGCSSSELYRAPEYTPKIESCFALSCHLTAVHCGHTSLLYVVFRSLGTHKLLISALHPCWFKYRGAWPRWPERKTLYFLRAHVCIQVVGFFPAHQKFDTLQFLVSRAEANNLDTYEYVGNGAFFAFWSSGPCTSSDQHGFDGHHVSSMQTTSTSLPRLHYCHDHVITTPCMATTSPPDNRCVAVLWSPAQMQALTISSQQHCLDSR